MTKNRICEILAGAMHCCGAPHVLGEPQPKAAWRPEGLMGRLNWERMAYGIFLLCLTTVIASPAQTFTTLHSFDGTGGTGPFAGLVQATNGNLYGSTNTAAKFTVVSKSGIKTTVPVGATTGKVKVKTPSGTLSSNVAFLVTK